MGPREPTAAWEARRSEAMPTAENPCSDPNTTALGSRVQWRDRIPQMNPEGPVNVHIRTRTIAPEKFHRLGLVRRKLAIMEVKARRVILGGLQID